MWGIHHKTRNQKSAILMTCLELKAAVAQQPGQRKALDTDLYAQTCMSVSSVKEPFPGWAKQKQGLCTYSPAAALGLRPGFLLTTTGALSASSSARVFFTGLRWRFLIGKGRSKMACCAGSTGISCAISSRWSSIPVICVAVLLLLPLVGEASKPEENKASYLPTLTPCIATCSVAAMFDSDRVGKISRCVTCKKLL